MENTRKILVEDFYKTSLTEAIAETGDVDFEVGIPPENTMGFIIVNPESSSLRERMFYHDVSGSRVYVRGVNRLNPKAHEIGVTVQINDTSNIFNYLSENLSTTFYIEKISALQVKVWGGPILKDNNTFSVADTTLNLQNNALNYIYYDRENNEIKTTLSESTAETGIITADVLTASGQISNISYRNYKLNTLTVTTGPSIIEAEFVGNDIVFTKDDTTTVILTNGKITLKGETGDTGKSAYEIAVDEGFVGTKEEWLASLKGETGDIGEPGPTGQYIEDTIVIDTDLYTITTNNSTFIRITENATGNYVEYNLNRRVWANADDEYSNYELITGTWGSIGLLEGIIYEDGLSIDTDGTIRYLGQPAYRDRENNFTETNTFNGTTIFKGDVSFPYGDMTLVGTTITFDANNGTKQKIVINIAGSYTINFTNLSQGANYEFAVVAEDTISLTIGTASGVDGTSFSKFSIGGESYPITGMTTGGPYMFVCETFTTGIHISYLGKSTPIT